MATAQESRVQTSITPPQSLVLMKNMIRLSVSSICYLRAVFPAECFSSRDYAGLKVHQIECAEKDENGETVVKNKDAFLLTQWLEKGVFAALAEEYLKTLTFAVYTKDSTGSDILIETYSFSFEYSGNGPSKLNGHSMDRESMKKQAVSFIRCLVEFTGTLDELPEDRWLTLKLTYYDEITPNDYEPHFFKSADSNVLQFDRNVLRVKIGKIETPSHTLNLKFAGVENADTDVNIPEETLSLEDMGINKNQHSGSGGFAHSLVRHLDESPVTLSSVKLVDELPKISGLAIENKENESSNCCYDDAETQVDDDSNEAMIASVKKYILGEDSATMRKCINLFHTEKWIVEAAFQEVVADKRAPQADEAYQPSSFNADAAPVVEESKVHKFARGKYDNSLKRPTETDGCGSEESLGIRRSKRIKGRKIIISDSVPDPSKLDEDHESQVIHMEASQGSVFTPHFGDKCSIIRDPLHPVMIVI